jgi:DNA replication protein DnaC
MTEFHASETEGHPPTLEQIEEGVRAAAEARGHEALRRQVETTPRQEHPEVERPDWEATVLAIADRSRPHREAQRQARERRDSILRQQRADRARAHNRTRSAAQIPPRYRAADCDHPEVNRWALAVAAGRTTDGLVLNGPTGCGKTWQAFGAWSLIAQHTGCRAYALNVPAYLESLRPGRAPLLPVDEVESAELLLLDDLAGERASDGTVEVVYRLIDARWNACLPTVVTLNAPVVEQPDGSRVSSLREQLGDRIASRLNGLGRVVSWPADAPDRRRPPTG